MAGPYLQRLPAIAALGRHNGAVGRATRVYSDKEHLLNLAEYFSCACSDYQCDAFLMSTSKQRRQSMPKWASCGGTDARSHD